MADITNLNPNAAAVRCILGGAGTGKTQLLVERVAELLKDGVEADDIRVFAASPNAVSSLRARLDKRIGDAAGDVRVDTMRRFVLEVLEEEDARAFTGRDPRLLLPFEANVLMEDVKTTGLRMGRLREMLKFFYRGWTELADDDPHWIISDEEELVIGTLRNSLSLSRGMLEPEASNLAVNYLRSDPAALEALMRNYVLVDDYQSHSFASQVLAGMLARTELWALGDPCMQGEVFESYPYASGLIELSEMDDVETRRLERSFRAPAAVSAANSLMKDECFGDASVLQLDDDGSQGVAIKVNSFASPEDELRGAAIEVKKLIDGGMMPGDIFVAVPNRSWSKNMTSAVMREDLAVDAMLSAQTLAGDVRDTKTCMVAMVFTALALVAHPESALAWRSWCGFGDCLASSVLFEKLRDRHAETGEGLAELLERLSLQDGSVVDEPVYNMQYALDAYAAGKAIVSNAAHLRGRSLLEALTHAVAGDAEATVPSAMMRICGPVAEDATAQELYECAIERMTFPSFACDRQAVKLGMYEDAVGLNPRAVVLAGFVNGFFPSHQYFDGTKLSNDQRERMHAVDTKKLYGLVSKANEVILVTYFTETTVETAGALKLKVDRIRLRGGRRVCSISPSDFLESIAG